MSLYIVATPIGNLDEISKRAIAVLAESEIILCEDTGNTKVLLKNIDAPFKKLVSYHKFNELARQDFILDKLKLGTAVALVSDAGTPCISDPGYRLVEAAAREGITVIAVNGPCALVSAVAVSGFPAEPFVYIGFLPKKDILKTISPLLYNERVFVFYESPLRIYKSIKALADNFPDISLCLCNDLTKKYERIYRGSPAEVLNELDENPHFEKGEYTCVVYNPGKYTKNREADLPSLESLIVDTMVKSSCTMKSAVKALAQDYRKNELYAASLRLKDLIK